MAVQIAIANINEEEFILNEAALPEPDAQHLRFGIDFGFNVNEEKQLFEIKTLINLHDEKQDNTELVRYRTAVVFGINGLNEVYRKFENGSFDLKNELMDFLMQTNISTVRGMLYTHLKDTRLSKFIIPIFDMKQMMENLRNKNNQNSGSSQDSHGIKGLK